MNEALTAETVTITGDGGDEIEAYLARPQDQQSFAGVVVIHHMPGYDSPTKEITRRFAAHGYAAVLPNLYYRDAPGASPDDAAAAARAKGGVPDERLVGDVGGAADYLRGLPGCNGKIGVIGYCSGGRQSFLAACSLQLDAAVDCYGGAVVNVPQGAPASMKPLIGLAGNLSCPLLGLFGADDQFPTPDETAELSGVLDGFGKVHEFHTFADAGHAFFAVDRTGYRVPAANDGWAKIWDFFGRYLAGLRDGPMCTYLTESIMAAGSGKGAEGWFRLSEVSVYLDHPVHAMADHTLNIDFLNPGQGPSARVAVELTAETARALADAIRATLDAAPAGLV